MQTSSLLKKYYGKLREIKRLHGIEALLEWDQETNLPVKAVNSRAEERAITSSIAHKKFTDKGFGKVLNELYDNNERLSDIDQRSVEYTKRNYDKATKVPSKFVEEFSQLRSLSQAAWIEAKTKEDYEIFKPYLKKVYDYCKKYSGYIDSSKPVYDVLLDDYEEGMTTKELNGTFSELRNELIRISAKISERESNKTLASSKFDKDITKKFLIEMTKRIGFDYDRGTIGEVHHPFETTLSENDVRINVRYPEDDISFSITSAIHELGHGLYEQFVDDKYKQTDLGSGVSLGIHESQSRLIENMIGRSVPFWTYFLPRLQDYYPSLNNLSVEDVVHDLNIVKPSFIRTEADEVTYNMHIILRFEMEQLLLNDEISFEEVPEIWNSKMKELLGIVPIKLSEGCLQDVHWSSGLIGYFPTYSLGNLNAGQLWNSFTTKYPNWGENVSKGDFSEYFSWFKENIWQYGSFYQPAELILNATGEKLNPKYFVEYLENKYF